MCSGGQPRRARANFLDRYQHLYGQTDPKLALGVRRVGSPPNEDVVFYQTFRGVPVFGAEIFVSLDRDRVVSIAGMLLSGSKLILCRRSPIDKWKTLCAPH